MLTKEKKKQLDVDLWIIVLTSVAILLIFSIFGKQINAIAYDASIPVVLRVLFMGGIFQYGLAGLGITIVCILRKESFCSFGLQKKGVGMTIFLTALCCVPDFLYNWWSGDIHAWLPFSDVNFTSDVLASGFPSNVLGMLITAICWGFFEGFNYVVISDKINQRYPSSNSFLNWGAIVCAIMCILVHGAIGVTPDAIMQMLVTMLLIYGMLLVKNKTGNAWGFVLLFVLYWNAI